MTTPVDVSRVAVSPNPAPLGAEMNLEIDYACSKLIPNARWVVQYTVDITATRAVIEVGASEPKTCDAGSNAFAFHADGIDFANVKKSALDNVGVLTATLRDADGMDVHSVVCVTQVIKTKDGGLTRRVISPLE